MSEEREEEEWFGGRGCSLGEEIRGRGFGERDLRRVEAREARLGMLSTSRAVVSSMVRWRWDFREFFSVREPVCQFEKRVFVWRIAAAQAMKAMQMMVMIVAFVLRLMDGLHAMGSRISTSMRSVLVFITLLITAKVINASHDMQ